MVSPIFTSLGRFDIGRDVTGFAGLQLFTGIGFGIETADFLYLEGFARMQEFHHHARLDFAVEHPDVRDHSLCRCRKRSRKPAPANSADRSAWRRHPLHDRFENVLNADTLLGAAGIAHSLGTASTSSNCCLAWAILACGKSILLMTGMI
jgi:hypothetical protein